MDSLLTHKEVAAILKLHRVSVYRLRRRNPAFPRPVAIGAALRFRRSEVEAFLADLPATAPRAGRKAVAKRQGA